MISCMFLTNPHISASYNISIMMISYRFLTNPHISYRFLLPRKNIIGKLTMNFETNLSNNRDFPLWYSMFEQILQLISDHNYKNDGWLKRQFWNWEQEAFMYYGSFGILTKIFIDFGLRITIFEYNCFRVYYNAINRDSNLLVEINFTWETNQLSTTPFNLNSNYSLLKTITGCNPNALLYSPFKWLSL